MRKREYLLQLRDPRHGSRPARSLGSNGWEKYIGETLCLSIDADHLEMPTPEHVHLLHRAMEETSTYLSGV